jgi:hypothetical protein
MHYAHSYDSRDTSATSDVLERTSGSANGRTRDVVAGLERGQIAYCTDRVCGYIRKSAADGAVARDANPGHSVSQTWINRARLSRIERGNTCTMRVAISLMHDTRLTEPCTVTGRKMMGHAPLALPMHQVKKMIQAAGVTMALSVRRSRWRLVIAC